MAEENQEAEDEEEQDGDAEEGEKKKKGNKKLFIIIAIVLVLAVGAAATFFMGLIPGLGAAGTVVHEESSDGGATTAEVRDESGNIITRSIYYDMEEFIVNLNVGGNTPSFLKMTISLELPSESEIPTIEAKMPRIRDSFQVYLRELRQQDLQGSAGMYRLREELLLRINKIVYPAKVNDILFKEILVQ